MFRAPCRRAACRGGSELRSPNAASESRHQRRNVGRRGTSTAMSASCRLDHRAGCCCSNTLTQWRPTLQRSMRSPPGEGAAATPWVWGEGVNDSSSSRKTFTRDGESSLHDKVINAIAKATRTTSIGTRRQNARDERRRARRRAHRTPGRPCPQTTGITPRVRVLNLRLCAQPTGDRRSPRDTASVLVGMVRQRAVGGHGGANSTGH